MKRLFILTILFLFCKATVLYAQETSERDYVDEQNMTVSEVEELSQLLTSSILYLVLSR